MPNPRACYLAALLLLLSPAWAIETLTFDYQAYSGATPLRLTESGKTLLSDSAGNRFFETDAGGRYLIPAANLIEASQDDRPFEPVTSDALGERMLEELPEGFKTHTTPHYVIAYSTSREYAEWTSSLLEGLYKVLVRYWKKQGIELEAPRYPLPIVIHRSAAAYNAAARAEGVGRGAVGYYHMTSNRVRMFDLTGSDELRSGGMSSRRGSRREITRMLTTPAAEPLVATIVHEATHQVCFNTGLMQRMADLPLWLVEGMAVYFEAPEAGSKSGWRGIGKVNRRRLATFQRNLSSWNASSLPSLIASDERLRDPRTAGAAYADAWALNYYLIKRRPDEYVAYVKQLSEREPLDGPPPDESPEQAARRRMAVFRDCFGAPAELEGDFLKVMSRL